MEAHIYRRKRWFEFENLEHQSIEGIIGSGKAILMIESVKKPCHP
jgi:hypothetical protein